MLRFVINPGFGKSSLGIFVVIRRELVNLLSLLMILPRRNWYRMRDRMRMMIVVEIPFFFFFFPRESDVRMISVN